MPAVPKLLKGQVAKLEKTKANAEKGSAQLQELLDKARQEDLKNHIPEFAIKRAAATVALCTQNISAIEIALEANRGEWKKLFDESVEVIKKVNTSIGTLQTFIGEAEAHATDPFA